MRPLSGWLRNLFVFLLFAVNPFNITDEPINSSTNQNVQNAKGIEMDQPQLVQKTKQPPALPPIVPQSIKRQALEFVHIPKTGGSSIETVGAKHGLTWGRCHYDVGVNGASCPKGQVYRQYFRGYLPKTPLASQWAPFWHIPPKFFRNFKEGTALPTGVNPYPVDIPLFAIVRNPYTRLVSEWYYLNQVQMKTPPETYNNATKFNIFLEEQLEKLMTWKIWKPQTSMVAHRNPYWMKNAHFIPQADYIYDDSGNQIVQHVFRFEKMREGFDQLMSEYGMSHVKLLKEKSNGSSNTALSVKHISGKNFEKINRLYRRDFKKFKYRMHIPRN